MTPEEFFAACAAHDWTFDYSDDHGVWQRGRAARDRLVNAKAGDPVKEAIFKAWSEYVFSGPAFSTERPAKPVIEDFA